VWLSLAQGLLAMSRQVVMTFLPIYVQIGLGHDAFELGIYVALLHGMGILSQPVLGLLSDRLGPKAVLVPSYATLGVLFLLLAVARPGWPLVSLIVLIGLFFYTLTNVTNAAVLAVVGSRVQSSAMGLTSVISQAIVLPAPILAGWLVSRLGSGAAFVLAAAFLLLGTIVLGLLSLRGVGGPPRAAG
jgi:MFS family permease